MIERSILLLGAFIAFANSPAEAAPRDGSISEILRSAKEAQGPKERLKQLEALRGKKSKTPEDVEALYSAAKDIEGSPADDLAEDAALEIHLALSNSTDPAAYATIRDLLEQENHSLPEHYFGPASPSDKHAIIAARLRLGRLEALANAAAKGGNESALPILRTIFSKGGLPAIPTARAIGKFKKPEDLDRMVASIKANPDARIDLTPFGEMAFDRIMQEVDSPASSDRQRAAFIARLAEAKTPKNTERYRALLQHKNPLVVKTAARVIANSINGDPTDALQMMQSDDRQVRISGLVALERVDWTPEVQSTALKLLAEDKDEGVRETTAYILGKRKVTSAQDSLTKALGDKSKRVREAAQSALDDISGKHQQEIDAQVQEILRRRGKK